MDLVILWRIFSRTSTEQSGKNKKSAFFLLGLKYTLRTCFDTINFLPKYLEIIFIHSRGWKGKTKSYFLDYEKPFKLELSCKNNVFYPISQPSKSKRRGFYLENWRIYGYLNVKIKMGVAGLIFEPHPPNFENQYNFWRCLNDIKMIFSYLYWF